jgi:hypothetical protein
MLNSSSPLARLPGAVIDTSIRFGNVDARKARLDICKHYAIML